MNPKNQAVPVALFLVLSLMARAAPADVCAPFLAKTAQRAPCFDGTPAPPLYGPWLRKCETEKGYVPQFRSQLKEMIEARIQELYDGSDRAWDESAQGSPTTSVPVICNLAAGETSTNRAGKACGSLPSFQKIEDQPRFTLAPPTAGPSSLHAYRMGAWVRAMETYLEQTVTQVETTGTLEVSPACESVRTYYAEKLATLGDLTFKLQPNREAIEDDRDPCPSLALGGVPEFEQYRKQLEENPSLAATHYNPDLVRNRMSGCLLVAARKKIEMAFVHLAACEVRARAVSADRDFFIAKSDCAAGDERPVFERLVEDQLLKGVCEPSARAFCEEPDRACAAEFDLNDRECWRCVASQVQSCQTARLPGFIAGTVPGAPAPTPAHSILTAQFLTPPIPALPPKAAGIGISYRFIPSACTDPELATRGCPSYALTLSLAGVKFAIDDLKNLFVAADGGESPLQGARELDSTPFNLLNGTSSEMPLDGIAPVVVFPGPGLRGVP